jgi:hypothetical protein
MGLNQRSLLTVAAALALMPLIVDAGGSLACGGIN